MELKTTREIGDKVFVIHKSKLLHVTVSQIDITTSFLFPNPIEIISVMDNDNLHIGSFNSNGVYATKEELIRDLEKQ